MKIGGLFLKEQADEGLKVAFPHHYPFALAVFYHPRSTDVEEKIEGL